MIIDNTQFNLSLNDTSALRQLILDNPDLPLLVFCGEESWQGIWHYNQADIRNPAIQTLALYDDVWVEYEDYRERLIDDLAREDRYMHMSDKEFYEMIEQKMAEVVFAKAIVMYIG